MRRKGIKYALRLSRSNMHTGGRHKMELYLHIGRDRIEVNRMNPLVLRGFIFPVELSRF